MTPLDSVPMFDYNIMSFVQENFHNVITDSVFPFITQLGEYGMIWIVISLILLVNKKTRTCGILCLIAMAAGFLFGEVFLKNVICRPRPCHDYPSVQLLVSTPSSYSFPSGHSSSSFAAATIIFICNKKWGISALIFAGLIAFSRVFVFVHYPTDILAGSILGVIFAISTYFIYKKLFIKNKNGLEL